MRGKVLNLFLEKSQLLDDRALTFIVSQGDPLGVSKRVLERMGCLDGVPLVLGLSDVLACLEGTSSPAARSVVMVTSGKGEEAPIVPRLPNGLPGAHKGQVTLDAPEAPIKVPGVRKIAPSPAPSPSPPLSPSPSPQTSPPTPSPMPEMPSLPNLPTHLMTRSVVKRVTGECSVEVLADITGESTCSGCIGDFVKYFQDRFNRLKRLLVNRREMMGALPVAAIRNRAGEVKTIGFVVERQSTSKGGVIFEIEDESGRIKVLCTKPEKTPMDVITDEVVGVVGTMNPARDLIYANQIVRPEIPVRRRSHRTERDLHVAFAGDIHVGSKTFLDTQWARFMDFLNGRLDLNTNGILDSLEVLVIPGDVVDGIGVFPGHKEELLITDIYRQYEALAELLKDIPDRIQVILTPGNHDAVRLAEPQPALPAEIRKLFSRPVRFLGNPALIDIEGVKVLSYHGKSIDDYVTHVQRCTYEDPVTVMKEMLKRRHLAPVYGGRTPIAPEATDHLVIETIPDIFVTGHVHGTGVEKYRDMMLINASAWQSQTNYQKSMNFVPDPAKVPVVNLRDMSVKLLDFAG